MSAPVHIDDVTPRIVGEKVREHLLAVSSGVTAGLGPVALKQHVIDLSFWCGMALGEAMKERHARQPINDDVSRMHLENVSRILAAIIANHDVRVLDRQWLAEMAAAKAWVER